VVLLDQFAIAIRELALEAGEDFLAVLIAGDVPAVTIVGAGCGFAYAGRTFGRRRTIRARARVLAALSARSSAPTGAAATALSRSALLFLFFRLLD
jgi:hypothetical protein